MYDDDDDDDDDGWTKEKEGEGRRRRRRRRIHIVEIYSRLAFGNLPILFSRAKAGSHCARANSVTASRCSYVGGTWLLLVVDSICSFSLSKKYPRRFSGRNLPRDLYRVISGEFLVSLPGPIGLEDGLSVLDRARAGSNRPFVLSSDRLDGARKPGRSGPMFQRIGTRNVLRESQLSRVSSFPRARRSRAVDEFQRDRSRALRVAPLDTPLVKISILAAKA